MKKAKKTFILTLLITFFTAILFLLYNPTFHKTYSANGFAGGTGTDDDPYLIETPEQLALLNNYLGYNISYFKLKNDIDLTEYLSEEGNGYNGGNGWKPIGIASHFNGKLEGKGFVIKGLWVNNSSSAEYAGLFGNIGNSGLVKNLGIEIDVNKVSGIYAGGISGQNYGTIENCYVIGDIEGKYAGGFVGYNSGSIKNCYAKGNIYGTENAGGFTGASDKLIENCYSVGQIINEGIFVGGFVGIVYSSSVKNCYSITDINVEGKYVGGFAGAIYPAASVENCYSIGDTTGGSIYAGGFAGYSSGSIQYCYSIGDTTGDGDYTGGFVGTNMNLIKNCYSIGTTTGFPNEYAGGFAGGLYGTIENCYTSGTVTGGRIGGLVGLYDKDSTIQNCYYNGDSEITGERINDYGTSLTAEQMMKKESFTGWAFNEDIDNIQDSDNWVLFEEGEHFPFLLKAGAVIIIPNDGQSSEYGKTPDITFKVSGTIIGGNPVKPEDYSGKLGLKQYEIGEQNIIINNFEINGVGQVWFVKEVKFTVTKASQPIVIGIGLESATISSITLTKIEGVEYRMGETGEWQNSGEFLELNANTIYIFYIRYKETEDKFAGSITSFTARTAKTPQDAVGDVYAVDITSFSIKLTEIEGAEYSLSEDGGWQDSSIFSGLNARTEYTFYIRFKETDDKAAGVVTSVTARTANKTSQPGVTGVVAVITTPSSITLTEIEEVEYRLRENGEWQNTGTFSGLNADTEYTFYFRYKETEDKFAGAITNLIVRTASKTSQPSVTGVVAVITTPSSITLTDIEGVEYRFGENGEWQNSSAFSGLKADTEYTFYFRYKETEDKLAGDITSYTAKTAKKISQPIVTGIIAVFTTPSSITLTEINTVEYRLESGEWQDSNIFSGLKADTQYTFYFRFKETEDKLAGDITNYTARTGKKTEQPDITGVIAINTTPSAITLTQIEGAEYRLFEDGEWQDSNIFSGLNSDTEYTFYFRFKETEDKAAGSITSFTVRTAKTNGNNNGDDAPDGSLIAIIVGSVAAVAVGVFCLCWFTIRKKRKAKK